MSTIIIWLYPNKSEYGPEQLRVLFPCMVPFQCPLMTTAGTVAQCQGTHLNTGKKDTVEHYHDVTDCKLKMYIKTHNAQSKW